MTTYILRRLLLMIPTLLGITFLVFMIVANAPGGIGATLALGGGEGADAGQNRAIQQAYLEDRYGLNDPILVQYVRWLERVSPLKFGTPMQRDSVGEVIAPPKKLDPPPFFGRYYGADKTLPEQDQPSRAKLGPDKLEDAEEIKARVDAYQLANNDYTNKRGAYIGAIERLKIALENYAIENGLAGPNDVIEDGKLNESVFRGHELDTDSELGQRVVTTGNEAVTAMKAAIASRDRLAEAYAARPFPDAICRIGQVPMGVPGFVYLAPPDFGRSFSKALPVSKLIAEALPVTLLLNCIAFPIIYIVAVPSGLLAATHRGSWFDTASGALYIALWSIPVVWAGVLAVGFLANKDYMGDLAFPTAGLSSSNADNMTFLPSDGQKGVLLDTLWHLCLPVACLVYTGFAVLSKQTRAAMLDNFNADYVRTAKAKGVSRTDIVFRHVFRNSLLPLITMFASIFPAMLAGSVVIEKIFTIPGMGNLVLGAIYERDRDLLLANALMIGAVNLLALLLADILYALADPRITFD
ncbi:MAG: ABC transporter permease subunit [Phycisphaerales bacterium JB050]